MKVWILRHGEAQHRARTDAERELTDNVREEVLSSAAHLLGQPRATVMTVSSGLAFVPMVVTPTYSATKAAIHCWSMALRQQLAGTSTEVIELAPPYVQTELRGADQLVDPAAMPLADFIAEVMTILETQPDAPEVIVERCKPLRFAAENGNLAGVFAMVNGLH